VGVDGVTVEQYGGQLAANVQALRARMKAGEYRHQPIRRVNIPKENGITRPIGQGLRPMGIAAVFNARTAMMTRSEQNAD